MVGGRAPEVEDEFNSHQVTKKAREEPSASLDTVQEVLPKK